MNLITTQLNKRGGNKTVLARMTKDGADAKTFVNDKQAEKAAAALRRQGVACWVWQGSSRVRYVVIGE